MKGVDQFNVESYVDITKTGLLKINESEGPGKDIIYRKTLDGRSMDAIHKNRKIGKITKMKDDNNNNVFRVEHNHGDSSHVSTWKDATNEMASMHDKYLKIKGSR